MESLFKSGFRSFLESSYIDFIEYGNSFIFPDYDFSVQLVPAGDSHVSQWRERDSHVSEGRERDSHVSQWRERDSHVSQWRERDSHVPQVAEGNLLVPQAPDVYPYVPQGSDGDSSFMSGTASFMSGTASFMSGTERMPFDAISFGGGTCIQEDGKKLSGDRLFLYEDRWWAAREMVQERILARLERFRSVFARKCRVLSGRGNPQFGEMVRDFLHKYHSYSSAKCRYRYALEYEGEIVAVATFSEGRPMVRRIDAPLLNVPKEEQENSSILIFDSYEWVRYASLPGVRVVGGMGRLLNAFIEERYTRIEPGTPLEVMTYSDTEWGSGDVYEKLGFKFAGERPPVEYHVHKETFKRLSQRLYEKELLAGALPEDFYTIHNLGSRKFLLQLL